MAAGLGVVLLWASAFPAIKVASPDLGPVGLSFLRSLFASVTLLMFAPLLRVRLPRRSDLPILFLLGLLLAGYQLLLNWGEQEVPAGTASVIVAAAPLVSVGIAAIRFGEPLTTIKIIGSVLALSGVAVVCFARSGPTLSAGVVIVVVAMVVQGIYHPLTKPVLRTYSGAELTTYGMIAATVVALPTLPFCWQPITDAPSSAWLGALYLGALPSAVGFILWGYAVANLPIATSTSLLYLVPAAAIVISFLWLHELPLPAELAGGAIVILGVVAISQGDRLRARVRHKPQPQPTAVADVGHVSHARPI
ncbi:EamA family transporter [Mycobacterium sp. AT1]|nr:EamA family transporter [Mycobacterium sp. AT1]